MENLRDIKSLIGVPVDAQFFDDVDDLVAFDFSDLLYINLSMKIESLIWIGY